MCICIRKSIFFFIHNRRPTRPVFFYKSKIGVLDGHARAHAPAVFYVRRRRRHRVQRVQNSQNLCRVRLHREYARFFLNLKLPRACVFLKYVGMCETQHRNIGFPSFIAAHILLLDMVRTFVYHIWIVGSVQTHHQLRLSAYMRSHHRRGSFNNRSI